MRAKKSLGQHFLRSERALLVMVKAGDIGREDTVLEIGPGRGALTEKLLATSCQLVAVEKDDALYELLKEKFRGEISSGQLKLVHDDILNFEFESHQLEASSYKLVANIPYNLTGAILKKFLETNHQPERMVFLVQKEVAERVVSKPLRGSTSKWKESILSISVKAYGKPRYVETVKAGSFTPIPKVDSAIIVIENISKDFFAHGRQASMGAEKFSEKEFFKTVRAGFKSKRKKFSSNLSMIFEKSKVLEVFKKLNLDDNLRAEDVGVETWQKLAQNLLLDREPRLIPPRRGKERGK